MEFFFELVHYPTMVLSSERVKLLQSARELVTIYRFDVLRFTGMAIGLFILINVAGELIRGPFDTLSDWVTLPGGRLPRMLAEIVTAAVLVVHGSMAIERKHLRLAGSLVLGAVCAVAVFDMATFYWVLAAGRIVTKVPFPASALVAVVFGALSRDLLKEREAALWSKPRMIRAGLVMSAVMFALPLVRMVTFGLTRYERSADCAVVLGARVHSDGTLSLALSDRVDEGVRQYHAGHARKLLMSGAIDGDHGVSEPRAMKLWAQAKGVPGKDILLDEKGDDTSSTARNTAAIAREQGFRSVLVVSHYYHEPRTKMLFERTGLRTYTVPAKMTRHLVKEPYFIVREVLAYYHSFLLE